MTNPAKLVCIPEWPALATEFLPSGTSHWLTASLVPTSACCLPARPGPRAGSQA